MTSLYHAFAFHIGSIALGSLVHAAAGVLRGIVSFVVGFAKGGEGSPETPLMDLTKKCCCCCLSCFDSFLQFINSNVYT